jgi:anti-sigma regulatory factor (Ser/Thr protein kinase)
VLPLEIHVEPELTALAPLRQSLDAWLERQGMTELLRAAAVLAAHEAVANAIQHSASTDPVLVRGEVRPDGFLIEITDKGNWKLPNGEVDEERGRGLDLIRALVSETEIRKSNSGTTVRLIQPRG